jgi:hypothetical protein
MSFFTTVFTPKKKPPTTSALDGTSVGQPHQNVIDALRNAVGKPSSGTIQPSEPESLATRAGIKPIDVGGSALPGDPGYTPNPLNEQPFQGIQSSPSVISGLAGLSKDQVDDTPIFADRKGPTTGSITFDNPEVFADRKDPITQNLTFGVGSSVINPQTTTPNASTDLSQGLTKPISRTDIKDDQPVDFSKTATNQGYSSALDELSGAVKGKGLSGTNAAIDSARQALLAANKQSEAQSGALAQRTGNIGQGVSNSMAQQTRQNALQSLAGQESKFIEMRSADQKAAIDQMVQAEQSEKGSVISAEGVSLQRSGQNLTLEQMNRQFSQFDASLKEQIANRMQQGQQFDFNRLDEIDRFQKTMQLTEKQWTAEFGSTEGQKYMNNLLELSIDNPVLAQKLQTYLLTDQKGAVGAFTPAEKSEIERLKAVAETREKDLDNIYAKTLELAGMQTSKEITSVTNDLAGSASQTSRIDEYLKTGDSKAMTKADWIALTEDSTKLSSLKESGKIKDFGTLDISAPGGSTIYGLHESSSSGDAIAEVKNSSGLDSGDLVDKNGVLYEVTEVTSRYAGKSYGNTRKRVIINAKNLTTGQTETIWASDKYDPD